MSEEAQQRTGESIAIPEVVDLQRMVERLERQEALLADAQRLASLGSWEWDMAHDRVSWSDELFRILGRERGGSPPTMPEYLDRVHPDDRSHVEDAFEGALREGGAFELEHRVVRPDGEVRTVVGKGRVQHGEGGAPVRVVGTAQDVTGWEHAVEERTARKLAEETARRAHFLAAAGKRLARGVLDYEGTLRNVAELAVESQCDWCAVELVGPEGEVRRVAVAHRDAGQVRSAPGGPECHPPLPGDPHATMTVPLEARGQVLGALTLVSSESGRRSTELDLRFAEELAARAALAIDNARLYDESVEARRVAEVQAEELEMQAEELQAQAEELEMQAEELQAQTDVLRAQSSELEQANAAKADFLAVMSHELRTPLNAISGYRELLALGVHGPLTEAQREALRRIQVNQRHLLRLINDVLSFARLEAGLVSYRDDVLEVGELLEGMRSLVEPLMVAKELSYRCEGCDPSLRVRGDRERIEQILLNLLANAVKFTPPGGSVALSCRAVEGALCFRVSDSGPGVEPGRWESIFDPFVQIGRGAGSENQGVGLGLAISRDLAAAMRGALALESSSPSGSTFTLTLPAA